MSATAVIALLLLAAIPPLDDEQRTRLETARDGFDYQDEAFAALLEHVRGWTPGHGGAAVRLEPDLAAMAADPAASRGALCAVSGTVAQLTVLPRPYAGVVEICLVGADDAIFIVYLPETAPLRVGDAMAVTARFYKRLGVQARDGRLRVYPALVGAFPRRQATRTAAMRLWVIAVPIGLMLLALAVLLVYTRRQRRVGPHPAPRSLSCPGPDADEPTLPEDPVDALTELRRRATDGS